MISKRDIKPFNSLANAKVDGNGVEVAFLSCLIDDDDDVRAGAGAVAAGTLFLNNGSITGCNSLMASIDHSTGIGE
jgi:hypothetical protein